MAEAAAHAGRDGFLLTRQWRDTPNGLEYVFWLVTDDGPLRVVQTDERAICFVNRNTPLPADVAHDRKALELCTLDGQPVDCLYFKRQRDLRDTRERCEQRGVNLHEADLKPSDRYLMERFITAGLSVNGTISRLQRFDQVQNATLKRSEFQPTLSWVSLDIETEGLNGRLYSIAAANRDISRVFIVSEHPVECEGAWVSHHGDEHTLLDEFFSWLAQTDPDLLLGWNLVNFDLDFLDKRCRQLGRRFEFGRGGENAAVLASNSNDGPSVARLPGRVALDGIELLRAAFWSFESFELEHVAQALLGRGKQIDHRAESKVDEINRLYANDRSALVRYNIQDCHLVADIFEKAGLIEFAVRRAELTGLAMDRLGGSVAAFDNLYLPRLHRRRRVAPSLSNVARSGASPGGYVMDSQPGLYDNVLVLDFKSLYPSIIRTFKIDPLGLAIPGIDPVPGFKDANFAREGSILAELIESLWRERDEAKRRGDSAMSQAVKILMNSFYGVLGANGCRFHDARLASSITLRGHEIIQRSREHIQADGFEVIYGDTDSLFVLLGPGHSPNDARAIGARLAQSLNAWWQDTLQRELRLPSHLEIEFETHFRKFLMPTIRGEQTGSKKRYAGLVEDAKGEHLVFKGLESVRTDWTPLAREFQRELYRRIFHEEPFEQYVHDTLERMLSGQLDQGLIYSKRLRRRLQDYSRNVPPHVQAARKLGTPVKWIQYIITSGGPEPVRDGEPLPRPDYAHYRERQLAPAADGILHFLDSSFEAITDAQMSMF